MSDAVGDCNGCVACCTRCGLPPFQNPAELAEIPEELAAPILNGTRLDESCSWLVDGACAHYECRPPICREFVVGGAQCQWFLGGCVGDYPWT